MDKNKIYLDSVSKYVKELEKLKDNEVVVGIPSSKNKNHVATDESNTTITLVELGAVHEYGAPEIGIPQRSFLRAPLQREASKLIEFIGNDLKFSKIDTSKALGRLGAKGLSVVLEAFKTQDDGNWQPLKPQTIAQRIKKSDKPLIDTGQLRQANTWEVRKRTKLL